MKDSKRENEHNRRERPDGDETLGELMSSYTPKQRETLLKGFRILAQVAIRAHMKRQEPGSDAPPERGEEGADGATDGPDSPEKGRAGE